MSHTPQPRLSEALRRPDYLRVRDIVRPNGVLPIARSTWYQWIATGKAPSGIRLSPGVVVWPAAQIASLVEA
jgi:prophage regulatory protein